MEIALLDHLIIAADGYSSFDDDGQLQAPYDLSINDLHLYQNRAFPFADIWLIH